MSTNVTPIVALDVQRASEALSLVDQLGDRCRFYKVGSELFAAQGPEVIRAIQSRGADVFLDLKFHDIPNTVRGAVRSASALGVRLVTVHASGGGKMLEAAIAGAREGQPDEPACEILAVTVLTSLDAAGLSEAWGKPVDDVLVEVLRLAGVAREAGVSGVVCSGLEASAVRAACGPSFSILVPGVRLAGAATQDQARVVTPRQAADAGATYIVLGRAVTAAKSPRDAMAEVLSDLS